MQIIYEEVAKRLNLKPYDVEGVVESVMKSTKDVIQAGEEPVVLLNHFCSFRMAPRNLDYYIKALIRKTREERENGSGDTTWANKLDKYWKLRQKLKRYKHV